MSTSTKKSLGRGLAALIPEEDMDFLRQVARQDYSLPAASSRSGTSRGTGGAGNKQPKNSSVAKEAEQQAAQDGGSVSAGTAPEASAAPENQLLTRSVPLADIVANPFQPRRSFSEKELNELADSIREHGVLQPVLLRPAGKPEKYQLIAGERRWRAAQKAELLVIPAIVKKIDDRQALELAIIENVQRHDISAIDAAQAYKRLAQEFSLSQDEIAHRVGKSRSSVANTLRLLDLPEEVRDAIEKGVISEGHGRAILMSPSEGSRRALLRRAVRDQLSVRETERLAGTESERSGKKSGRDDAKNSDPSAAAGLDNDGELATETAHTDAELKDIANRLEKRFGARIAIRSKGNRGGIVISYAAPADLERIVGLLLPGS